jgi:hypothetical protein
MIIPVNILLNRTVFAIVVAVGLRVPTHARIVHDAFEVVPGICFDRPTGLDHVLDEGGASALILESPVHGEAKATFGDAVAFLLAGASPTLRW